MIHAENLTKDYGTVVAVKRLSFDVGKGEVVGFLGPNGAGKSTTLRMLAGFLGPTEGRVEIGGFDIQSASEQARAQIGYMPESSPLYPEMRVGEYLAFRAHLKRVARKERKAAVERAMELAVVTEMRDTLIQHLSKGYRQRVGLADALVSNPPLLILDEPTAGLDPNQIREVRRVIKGLGEEHTILLSTHILPEVESTCDRALVIDRGKLVAQGTIEELRALRAADAAVLVVRDADKQALPLLKQRGDIERVKQQADAGRDAGMLRITFDFKQPERGGEVLESIVAELVGLGVGVREAAPRKASLEDVFAQLTGVEDE
ncbi:MAG: ABC transporter ATP-binding protein [Polyangiaceae bacterium]|nr:ABC transporter ATP-binding protein [Myxococcales bacterium]MCB9589809.1 ABC transporter ATP-binding protein [Polyangiaceae bacterium]